MIAVGCALTSWLLEFADPFALPSMAPFAAAGDFESGGPLHSSDPERQRHPPFLYAVWAASVHNRTRSQRGGLAASLHIADSVRRLAL